MCWIKKKKKKELWSSINKLIFFLLLILYIKDCNQNTNLCILCHIAHRSYKTSWKQRVNFRGSYRVSSALTCAHFTPQTGRVIFIMLLFYWTGSDFRGGATNTTIYRMLQYRHYLSKEHIYFYCITLKYCFSQMVFDNASCLTFLGV